MVKRTINNQSTYQQIECSRKILKLPERASMATIKQQYRLLLKQWHPDTCSGCHEQCVEMTRRITEAYNIIMTYCNGYEYSFSKEEIRRYRSAEEWWSHRFSDVPW